MANLNLAVQLCHEQGPSPSIGLEAGDALTAWVAAGGQATPVAESPEDTYCLHQLARLLAQPMPGVDIDAVHRVHGEGG